MIDKAGFTTLFFGGFRAAHLMTGLNSLHVPEGDKGATAAAEALHDTIMDVPALHFLLQPQGKWLTRVFVIGSFVVPLSLATARELKARATPQAAPGPADFGAARAATRTPDGSPSPDQAAALGARL